MFTTGLTVEGVADAFEEDGVDFGGGGGACDSKAPIGAPNFGVAKPPGPKMEAFGLGSAGVEEVVCVIGPAGALLVGETGWTQGSYPALAVELFTLGALTSVRH